MNPGAGYAGIISWSLGESGSDSSFIPACMNGCYLLTLLKNIFHHIHKRFRLPGSSFYSQVLFSFHQK